tara:strand:+ start:42 stop:731 length:690 start_codon:yes stop_codon:yes gene_type:complete
MKSTSLVNEITWHDFLTTEKKKPYFKQIMNFLEQEKKQNKIIYPPPAQLFNALTLTPFMTTRVVIIGQDPYHGPNQAMGLCFSVNKDERLPPSLKNIYKELNTDLGITPAPHGDLSAWAKQGVLLLNATLSVEAHTPQSHANIGWNTFTDAIIITLNNHPKPIVYLLWGAFAHKKSALIDTKKHHVLKTTHPSPLSAYRGFLGSKVFSKTNHLLEELGHASINWAIAPM